MLYLCPVLGNLPRITPAESFLVQFSTLVVQEGKSLSTKPRRVADNPLGGQKIRETGVPANLDEASPRLSVESRTSTRNQAPSSPEGNLFLDVTNQLVGPDQKSFNHGEVFDLL